MISPSLHPGPISAVCQRRRRWSFALTPRSIGLLLAGFVWLVPGFWDGRLAYAMPAWDALVLFFALLDGLRLPAPAELTASRTWSNAPALDSETEIELMIENRGRLILDCRLVDDLPPALVAESETHWLTAFPRIPVKLRYRVQPTERGDWETGWLYVRYRSPLGLIERWARAPLTQTVRVYPALRAGEEQQIFLARSRQIDLQLRRSQQRGLGRDFESLRDYREGDDLRDICWTATARRGSPITRQYQTERSQPVWIVLDCGRLMRARVAMARTPKDSGWAPSSGPAPNSKLDHACTTAVALAQLALYSGDRVGLLAYGHGIQQRLLARPRRGPPAAAHRVAGPGARRSRRGRPSARHGHAQPPATPPVSDFVGDGFGRDRHAPRSHRRRSATAAPPRASCLSPWPSRRLNPSPRQGLKTSSRCSAPPPPRRWPAAANCFSPASTSRARSPST